MAGLVPGQDHPAADGPVSRPSGVTSRSPQGQRKETAVSQVGLFKQLLIQSISQFKEPTHWKLRIPLVQHHDNKEVPLQIVHARRKVADGSPEPFRVSGFASDLATGWSYNIPGFVPFQPDNVLIGIVLDPRAGIRRTVP